MLALPIPRHLARLNASGTAHDRKSYELGHGWTHDVLDAIGRALIAMVLFEVDRYQLTT